MCFSQEQIHSLVKFVDIILLGLNTHVTCSCIYWVACVNERRDFHQPSCVMVHMVSEVFVQLCESKTDRWHILKGPDQVLRSIHPEACSQHETLE